MPPIPSGRGLLLRCCEVMTSDNSLSLILRRLDEIERKLDRMLEELGCPRPSVIRCAGAIFQGRSEPARPPNGRWWPSRLVAAAAEDRLSFGGQLPTYSRSPFETGMKRHAFR